MKIYLDNCSLQRPFDDLSQDRIKGEAVAIIKILAICEAGTVELISSEVLEAEIFRILDGERKEKLLQILKVATHTVFAGGEIVRRAKELQGYGIKAFDALHFASAEADEANYFCTSDDKLLKNIKTVTDTKTEPVTPAELLEKLL